MPSPLPLIKSCAHALRNKISKVLFATPLRAYLLRKTNFEWESYGMYRILRDYTGVEFNHRNIILQHGWTPMPGVIPSDYLLHRDISLAWTTRYQKDWVAHSKKPCYVITAPYVLYRREKQITQAADAKGTLFYAAHSTTKESSNYDVRTVCEQLKALPEQFQPITISVYTDDKHNEELNSVYREFGFNTVCLTDFKGTPYYEAFYKVISQFRYTASNEPGTYSFYSIEMGTPFFCIGEPAIRPNTHRFKFGQSQTPECITICHFEYGKKAYDLFAQQPYGHITEEQRKFVESELGITDGISKEQLTQVLKKASS